MVDTKDRLILSELVGVAKESGKLEETVTFLSQELEKNPDDYVVSNAIGRSLLFQGKTDEAEQHWLNAAQQNPKPGGSNAADADSKESRGY